jgi:hypothetical protein
MLHIARPTSLTECASDNLWGAGASVGDGGTACLKETGTEGGEVSGFEDREGGKEEFASKREGERCGRSRAGYSSRLAYHA